MLAVLLALFISVSNAKIADPWSSATWRVSGNSITVELLKDPFLTLERDADKTKWYPATNMKKHGLKSYATAYAKNILTKSEDLYLIFSDKDRTTIGGLPNVGSPTFDKSEKLAVYYATKMDKSHNHAHMTFKAMSPQLEWSNAGLVKSANPVSLEREGWVDTALTVVPWITYGLYMKMMPTQGKIAKQDEAAITAMLKDCIEDPNIDNKLCDEYKEVPEAVKFSSSAMSDLERDLSALTQATQLEREEKKLDNWSLHPWGMILGSEAFVPEN